MQSSFEKFMYLYRKHLYNLLLYNSLLFKFCIDLNGYIWILFDCYQYEWIAIDSIDKRGYISFRIDLYRLVFKLNGLIKIKLPDYFI